MAREPKAQPPADSAARTVQASGSGSAMQPTRPPWVPRERLLAAVALLQAGASVVTTEAQSAVRQASWSAAPCSAERAVLSVHWRASL